MCLDLVYHKDDGSPSPFDRRAIDIADGASFCIACPYLSLEIVSRWIRRASHWRLITDIVEWLGSSAIKEREAIREFVSQNADRVRDHQGLHAKVLIGDKATMIGSANFTKSGISRRTEMGVYIDDAQLVRETLGWFDALWAVSISLQVGAVDNFVSSIPLPKINNARSPRTNGGTIRDVALIALPARPQYLQHSGAIGYYTGNGNEFCVVKFSPARSFIRPSFKYGSLRERLVRDGVLARSDERSDYQFTEDHLFSSPSAALAIVTGQSRNGRSDWKLTTKANGPYYSP